jgi:hypothetical protein
VTKKEKDFDISLRFELILSHQFKKSIEGLYVGVMPHSKVGDKPDRGIGETHGTATLNGP